MEIREFAELILHGTTLEDKLTSTEGLTDDRPGEPLQRPPAVPGRPEALRLDLPRERVAFPGLHELDRQGTTGRILHFFANHELLATELMALALLRFPEAPPAFRRGLVHTIEEEQRHLRMYHERMHQDGVELGEIPVSSFFWDCLVTMESPMDFVTGMSLTFEQANLDYSRFYADAFRTAGDQVTAELLDVVHREEIGHVKHGVTWFERWREHDRSAFDAWRRLLPEPLTPARARGMVFDAEGRRRAGLDEDFIRRVEVFGDSRGRPPGVWLFNPSCEHRWVHGDRHPLPAAAAAIEADLDTVPLLLARTDDVVLVRREPAPDFLRPLAHAGFPMPRFIVAGEEDATADIVPHRHLSELLPWGWSPDATRRLAPLRERLVASADAYPSDEAAAAANRKALAAGLLGELLHDHEDHRLSPPGQTGGVHEDASSAVDAIREILASAGKLVVKADHGTSGRGSRRVFGPEDLEVVARWVRNVLERQRAVVVEPWLDRVADLSIVGHVTPRGEVQVAGTTRFLSDHRGQYHGSVVGKPWFGLDPELARFCHGDGQDPRFSARVLEDAARRAAEALHGLGYHGPFGVDAFIHRHEGSLRLRPLVEINARWTMGHVALALGKRLSGGVNGVWRIVRKQDLKAPEKLFERVAQRAPLELKGEGAAACIQSGVLCLSDPRSAERVLAVLVAGRTVEEISRLAAACGLGDPWEPGV